MGPLLELFFTGFVLYLIYKLIFGLIVPVSKATASVRDKMREMQEEQVRKTQTRPSQAKNAGNTTTTDGEYIDFEEVK